MRLLDGVFDKLREFEHEYDIDMDYVFMFGGIALCFGILAYFVLKG